MEVLALSLEWDGPYDELYEYFDAPKFVDLTNEDSVHVDDCYWFCSRVGCDQKHGEESECEATENIFSAMTKCPNSAPPKSIRPPASRLATLPSSKAGMRLKGGVQGPEVVSSSLTPNKKVKSRVAKALIFQSPKKSVTPEASLELKTPMKYSKPKPTNPKPFRLRTAERSILKEARREKRVRSVTPTPKNDTTLQTGKCDREIVLEKRGFASPAAMAAMSGVGSLCAGDRTYRESNMSFSSSNYAARGVISCSVGRELGFRRASVCLRNPRFEVSALIRENDDKGSTTTSKSKSSSASALELLKTSSANRYTKERSSIIVIGISVHTSPVEMREKFAIPEAQWPQAIQELCTLNHIEEAAVLSTCNRMEIYVVALSQSRGVKEVTEWMSKTSGVRVSELCEHRFLLYNGDAVQHLFEVSAGLDSLVLGESQILAQVKQVVKSAEGVAGFDRKISGLFKRAITVGKRVRTETKIGSGAVSVSSAAVELGLMKISESSYENVRVLVVGVGKMGKLVVKHLVAKGCRRIVAINRTEERAAALVEEYKDIEIIWKPLSDLVAATAEADVIFTCTGSEMPLLLKEHVDALPSNGSAFGGVRHFIDISVPRNVGTCVSDIDKAKVYNVDDLKDVVTANKELRLQKANEAKEIISQELKEFVAWMDSLETVPTIKKLRAYAERVRAAELDKCMTKMGENLSNQQKKAIHDLSMGIVNKLLHGPMQHLRYDGSSDRSLVEILDNMHALNRIFDLDTDMSLLEEKIRTKLSKTKK